MNLFLKVSQVDSAPTIWFESWLSSSSTLRSRNWPNFDAYFHFLFTNVHIIFKITFSKKIFVAITISWMSLHSGAWNTATEKICSSSFKFCLLNVGIEVSWSERKNLRLISLIASRSFLLTRSGSRLKNRRGAQRSHCSKRRFQRFDERWNGALIIWKICFISIK